MANVGDPEPPADDDDVQRDTSLVVVMGNKPGRSLRICVDGDPIEITARRDRVCGGSTPRWRRAGVITGSDDGSRKTYRFWLIEFDPGTGSQAIEFDPFRVEGRFNVLERARNKAASEAFAAFKESTTAK